MVLLAGLVSLGGGDLPRAPLSLINLRRGRGGKIGYMRRASCDAYQGSTPRSGAAPVQVLF